MRALWTAALVAALSLSPAQARLVVMHGYADYTSATLWVQADREGPVEIDVAAQAGAPAAHWVREALAAEDGIVALRVPGLAPGSTYSYRVRAAGEERTGTLRTQRYGQRGEAPELTLALGSCHNLANANPVFGGGGGDYQIFDAIAARHPDAMLWLGDNVYLQTPDFTDPTSMAARYRQYRAFAPLQRLLTATAHIDIWDDHDYGPNNTDRSYAYKGETLKLFKRYWPNPGFGLPNVPGTFGWIRLGDVELFLLDDRYYRSSDRAPMTPDKTMFGAAQLAWLKDALLSSHATLKLIVGGSQFLNRANRFEGLHQFPHEQADLLAWLASQRIEGVVFVSGDRHFGELLRIARPGAYPLYEITSSPLSSTPVAMPDEAERANPDVVPGTFRNQRQFGLLHVTGPGRRAPAGVRGLRQQRRTAVATRGGGERAQVRAGTALTA